MEKVGEKALKEAVAKVMAAQMEVMLKKSLETAHKGLRGKDVGRDEFAEETQKDLYKELAKLVLVGLLKK
jgi:hypothetical protein